VKVYRIVYRRAGSIDEWKQSNSCGSFSGRPYVSASVAKGEATRRARRSPSWEFKVQVSELNWEDI
jgi:hypothetical protein